MSQYVRHRAALGAKFHGVNWASVPELPAPPLACKRRVQILMKNDKFRKAVMRLCNLLSERYAKHLETKQKDLPESNSSHVLVRYSSHAIGGADSDCVDHGKDISFDEEKWDDFNEKSISQAFNDVLELKKMAKLVAPKRTRPGSREWSNRDLVDEVHPYCLLFFCLTPCLQFLHLALMFHFYCHNSSDFMGNMLSSHLP